MQKKYFILFFEEAIFAGAGTKSSLFVSLGNQWENKTQEKRLSG